MKTSVFEKLIRKVIREEIDYALRREIKTLKEDLRDKFKPTIMEQPKVPKVVQNSLKEKIMGKQISKQNFSSNNTLNDLLNETAQGDTNLESLSSPESAIPVGVANVVNRDYRELMRAIEKKKNHRP
jgi:hypothetical protein